MLDDPHSGSSSEEPGTVVVLRALRGLTPPITGDGVDEGDFGQVADLLMDHADRFDGTRLLYYMTAVMIPPLDELTKDLCEREYLLLDPIKLAEDAVAKLFASHLDGGRLRPFARWAARILGDVGRRAVTDRSLLAFRPEHDDTYSGRVTTELAWIANRLPFDARRLIWLSFRESRSEAEIAQITGLPFERVEFLLSETLTMAMNAVAGVDGRADDSDPEDQDVSDA